MSRKKARHGKAADLEDSLCCCEYIDQNGEKNHMVACFCDCEDLDNVCDRWITCKPLKPETLQRTVATILDRFRIPWYSGARKIEISVVPPLLLLPALLHVAALHYLLTIIILTSLPVVVLWYYYLTHRNKGQTLFFLSLGLFSLGYMYYTFLREVVPRGHVGMYQVFMITSGVLLMLGALTQAKKDPGYLNIKPMNIQSSVKDSIHLINRRASRSNGFHNSLSSNGYIAEDDAVGCARTLSENPGVIDKDWCMACKLVKPARSGHCRICSACVSRMDHHCVWINNCIGESNHRAFLCALSFFLMTAIYGITLTLGTVCRTQSIFIALIYCPGVYADYRESVYDDVTIPASSPGAGPETNSSVATHKWEEQQKVLALEQLCGVFRVDLGQMRSLRLFFSDEACTSGQLVIASRESQYKVFHFHHGGLDKLSEVFQQWKYCRETQLSDQVADEKTCMQFSIRRPNLPSSESHPEENMYKRLDVSAWLRHLNESGQVEEEYKLRKAIFFGGIDVSIRGEVWPFLLHYYSCESSSQERESLRMQRRREYFEIQQKRLTLSPEKQKEFWRNVQFTVDKDVVRTDRSNSFFRGEDNPNVESMRRILLNYAVYNPSIGYSQGMSDLVAPILVEVLDESDTFWCFVGLMQNTIFISSPRDEDMEKQLMYLRELLRLMHPQFYQHLVTLGEDGLQMLFCHRWILLCFKREFPCAEALRIWEACWAHYQTDYFHLFICVGIVGIYGDDVVEQQLATDQMLLHFGNLSMHMNGELVLRKARSLLYQFRLLPRIPCSLHDLCKLCGTGMWDSGSIPAVACSGNHPDSEGCPYGGTVEELSPKQATEGKRGQRGLDVFHFKK